MGILSSLTDKFSRMLGLGWWE